MRRHIGNALFPGQMKKQRFLQTFEMKEEEDCFHETNERTNERTNGTDNFISKTNFVAKVTLH